jgi:hypothetical protein
MAIDFPASPTLNDVFTVGNVTYVWDGTKWTASVTGGISLDKIEEGNTSAEVIDTGSDGRFVVTTEGTERLRVTDTGLVGIGTAAPSSLLSLGDAVADQKLLVYDNSGSTAKYGFGIQAGEFRSFYPSDARATFGTVSTADGSTFSEKVRIDSSGRVGIGTSTPATVVDIEASADAYITIQPGTTDGNVGLLINNSAGTQKGVILYDTDDNYMLLSTENTERMRIDSAGRLGIGTTNPQRKLVVSEGGAQGFEFYPGDAGGGNTLNHYNRNTSNFVNVTTTADQHIWARAEGEKARIDSSGRLLVGTSTNIGSQNIQIGTAQGTLGLYKFANNDDGGELTFATSRNGTVGSQTIVNNGDFLGRMFFRGSDGSAFIRGAEIACRVDGTPGANDMPGRLSFSTTADGASSPTERMRITQGGHVLIGCTSLPNSSIKGAGFYITNTDTEYLSSINTTASKTHVIFYNPNGTVGTIATSGSATAYNTSSDYRLKENVTPVSDGITRLQQLKPSRFNFIVDPDKTVDGFLAHEVQTIVPEAITGEKDAVDDEGNPIYQGIDQSKLVPLLTAALQEAIAKIETLEGMIAVNNITIDEQQHQLSTLAARLTALESA